MLKKILPREPSDSIEVLQSKNSGHRVNLVGREQPGDFFTPDKSLVLTRDLDPTLYDFDHKKTVVSQADVKTHLSVLDARGLPMAKSKYRIYIPSKYAAFPIDPTVLSGRSEYDSPENLNLRLGYFIEPHNRYLLRFIGKCGREPLVDILRSDNSEKSKIVVGNHSHVCTLAAAIAIHAAQADNENAFANACLEGAGNFIGNIGKIFNEKMFFSDAQAAEALRRIAADMVRSDGADPSDLMDVGTSLIAYSLNHYDHHRAVRANDIGRLYKNVGARFMTRQASPFEYGIFCGLIFGGFIKYAEKLGEMDTKRKEQVKIVVDTVVGALGGVAPLLPAAAIFTAGGVTLIGDIVTTYIMKQRNLRGASLKLVGRFLAEEHRSTVGAPMAQKEAWKEIRDGLDLSLLCAGLR